MLLVILVQLATKGCCFILFVYRISFPPNPPPPHPHPPSSPKHMQSCIYTNLESILECIHVYFQFIKENINYNQINFVDLLCKTWLVQHDKNAVSFNYAVIVIKIFRETKGLKGGPVQCGKVDAFTLGTKNRLHIMTELNIWNVDHWCKFILKTTK